MIKYVEGDIFNSPAQVLVNTVNTVGVMGKGIALSFKKRYPEMFNKYRMACEKNRLTIGRLMLWYGADHWVLMFPTKENWRKPSRIEYIEKGLMTFKAKYADYNITSIAFPKLGCGNGELDWNEVKPLMEKYLDTLPIDVYVYLGPGDQVVPEHRNIEAMEEWLKKNAKELSFTAVKEDIVSRSTIVPIEFNYANSKVTAKWENDYLIFILDDSNTIIVTEEEFRVLWDEIRNQCVFPVKNSEKEDLVYYLLYSLDYLTAVKIQLDNDDFMGNGFQLDEGLGRYYSVKGMEV